jgi:hypothetical protein
MYFSVEQFGTLLGRFSGVFYKDLEQFGTPGTAGLEQAETASCAQLSVKRHNNGRRAKH